MKDQKLRNLALLVEDISMKHDDSEQTIEKYKRGERVTSLITVFLKSDIKGGKEESRHFQMSN